MNFEQALQAQLPKLPPRVRHFYQAVLALPDTSRLKQRILGRLESEARAAHNLPEDGTVDWTEGATNATAPGATPINWANLLQLIAQLLPIILALFGA